MITMGGYRIKTAYILIGILVVAGVMRLWGLGSAEIFHDEGFDAFRSIGYLDYVQNDNQSTPVQWFNPTRFSNCKSLFETSLRYGGSFAATDACSQGLFDAYRALKSAEYQDARMPWWSFLSFHDDPPLFFIIQHFFFTIFGDSLLIARLPSVLAGIIAVWLLFMVAGEIFASDLAGLAAAGLLAVNHIHVWISRSSLLESVQITVILAAIYCLLQFTRDRSRWFWLGVALGAAFLTKYTSIFLVPVVGVYVLGSDWMVDRRRWFAGLLDRRLYAAAAVSVLLFAPVLAYNFFLYRAVGHFDLQFAYLFKQATPEWQASLGKMQDPFSDIGTNMAAMYSIPFLVIAVFGFAIGWGRLGKERWALLAVAAIVSIACMLVKVGSAYRFLALVSPFLVLAVVGAWQFARKYFHSVWIWEIAIIVFAAYELFFAIDGIFLTFPDFGVTRLDHYFDVQFDGKRSPVPPDSSNPFLESVIRDHAFSLAPLAQSVLVVYDENIDLAERLWLFARRIYYHGIPAVTTGQFKSLLQSRGPDSLKGYEIYFVKASSYTSLNPLLSIPDAADLERFLQQQLNLQPSETITGYSHLPMFWVYKFTM